MLTAHPHLPEFEYILPENIAEASRFLYQNHVEACVFLCGTDILVRLRNGDLKIKYLVDVKKLKGMNDITLDPDTGLRIGSAVSMNRIIESEDIQRHYPVLVEAAKSVASYQLRTRATIVGNICNASPAGDTIGACLVLDASLGIHGLDGNRIEPLNGFFR
ncbi:MAG: FAD binding domain-containing protein, partial [Anaerolineaceae bacterium]|nr:FAD binding domain-containing protein [Anaerolineaceae bacterium]